MPKQRLTYDRFYSPPGRLTVVKSTLRGSYIGLHNTLLPGIEAYLGRRRASRAVGRAVARKPLPSAIPCRRIVGGDSSLTGNAAGLRIEPARLHPGSRTS